MGNGMNKVNNITFSFELSYIFIFACVTHECLNWCYVEAHRYFIFKRSTQWGWCCVVWLLLENGRIRIPPYAQLGQQQQHNMISLADAMLFIVLLLVNVGRANIYYLYWCIVASCESANKIKVMDFRLTNNNGLSVLCSYLSCFMAIHRGLFSNSILGISNYAISIRCQEVIV